MHEYARQFEPPDRQLTVVELGSWKGRSTIALAMGLKARGHGIVFAIDPHAGGKEHLEVDPQADTFAAFLENIRAARVVDYVTPLRTTSNRARPSFAERSVDLLFVDGSHRYDDVVRDISDWTTALKEGAIVGFNDPLYPDVYRALAETALAFGSPFRILQHVDNTLFVRYTTTTRTLVELMLFMKFRSLLWLRHCLRPFEHRLPRPVVLISRRIYRALSSF